MKVNAVEVSAVSRHYRKKQVLREISFDVESGESVVIVGKTDAGNQRFCRLWQVHRKPTVAALLILEIRWAVASRPESIMVMYRRRIHYSRSFRLRII